MAEKEVMHLIGDFRPDVLERWTKFAELTNRTIKHTTYAELQQQGLQGTTSMLIIMDDHGLNDLPL